MRITSAWGDTVTLLQLDSNALYNTETGIINLARNSSVCSSISNPMKVFYQYLRQNHYLSIKKFGENGWVEIVNRIFIAKFKPFLFFPCAFWSAMFLYKSILYSALTFAHTRGLQQKLLLKIMEILTFLFAFDWINLQYSNPVKMDSILRRRII